MGILSSNWMVNRVNAAFQSRSGIVHFWLMLARVKSVLHVHVGGIEMTLGMGLAHLAADLVALGVSEAPGLEVALGGTLS